MAQDEYTGRDPTLRRYGDDLFRRLVETVEDYGIIALDPEGHVLHWNKGAALVTGFSETEVLGRRLTCIFTPEDLEAGVFERELQVALATGRVEDERWHMRKDGSRFWALGVVVPLRDREDNLLGYGKILRDRTDLKELQETLRHRAEELAEADERKDVFLATLAHELRNLLAPLANCVQILRLAKDRLPEGQRIADIVDNQVWQMSRLVDDLMDVSRISRGKMQLNKQRVLLDKVVAEAVETTRALLEARRHYFQLVLPPVPVALEADPDRLRQVLVNLLNNAAKYTEPGGHIVLAVDIEDDEAVIRVRDTGIGIPPEQMSQIFELFAQAHPASHQSQSGLGIGLALVRDLVAMHGGTVQARSEGVGRGTEFTVRLPLPARGGPRP